MRFLTLFVLCLVLILVTGGNALAWGRWGPGNGPIREAFRGQPSYQQAPSYQPARATVANCPCGPACPCPAGACPANCPAPATAPTASVGQYLYFGGSAGSCANGQCQPAPRGFFRGR